MGVWQSKDALITQIKATPPTPLDQGATQTRAPAQGPPRRAGSVPLPALRSHARAGGRREATSATVFKVKRFFMQCLPVDNVAPMQCSI
jgi:hypothetical protein